MIYDGTPISFGRWRNECYSKILNHFVEVQGSSVKFNPDVNSDLQHEK